VKEKVPTAANATNPIANTTVEVAPTKVDEVTFVPRVPWAKVTDAVASDPSGAVSFQVIGMVVAATTVAFGVTSKLPEIAAPESAGVAAVCDAALAVTVPANVALVTVTVLVIEAAAALDGTTESIPKPNDATATSAMRLKVVFVDICFLSISRALEFPDLGFR
jgi:hypothetical protein